MAHILHPTLLAYLHLFQQNTRASNGIQQVGGAEVVVLWTTEIETSHVLQEFS